MAENICSGCEHDKLAPDGICNQMLGADGGVVRCVGEWSLEKHYYLRRYIDIFTTSMRRKWQLCYLDFFAGPGLCRVRETCAEIEASPLIALSAKYPFRKYIFIDQDPTVCEILKARASRACKEREFDPDCTSVILGDCNALTQQIGNLIPQKSLSLCFLDPTGLQLRFSTLSNLARGSRKIDLIINFPIGMALKRNIDQFYSTKSPTMSEFWGDDSWRDIYESLPKKATDERFVTSFIQGYRNRLATLGYQEVKLGSEIGIKHYYYLLFASKNPLGQKFWREISITDRHGQRRLQL